LTAVQLDAHLGVRQPTSGRARDTRLGFRAADEKSLEIKAFRDPGAGAVAHTWRDEDRRFGNELPQACGASGRGSGAG